MSLGSHGPCQQQERYAFFFFFNRNDFFCSTELIVAESVVVIKKLLQLHGSQHTDMILRLAKILPSIVVADARASIIWFVFYRTLFCIHQPRHLKAHW